MNDNYHQHRPSIILHEAEHHKDHNHETETTILQVVEIKEITKDIKTITMIEV